MSRFGTAYTIRFAAAAVIVGASVGCDDPTAPFRDVTLTLAATTPTGTTLVGDTLHVTGTLARPDGTPTDIHLAWADGGTEFLGIAEQVTVVLPDTGRFEVRACAFAGDPTLDNAVRALVTTCPGPADTIVVTVEPNTPPAVTLEQAPALWYATDTAVFAASATDPESAVVIEWLSDKVGLVGVGDTLRWSPGNDASGRHTLTARARDAQGATTDTTVTVIAMTTARWKWSRIYQPISPTTLALPLAIGPDGTVYAGQWQGGTGACVFCVWAVDPAEGDVRWTYALEYAFWDWEGGLTVAPDGTIFVFDQTGRRYALSAGGTLLWQNASPDFDLGRFALSPSGALFAAGHGGRRDRIQRLDPQDGSVVWEVAHENYQAGPTVRPDDSVSVSWGGSEWVLDPGSGERRETAGGYWGLRRSAMDWDGTAYYAGNFYDRVTAVDASGGVKWQSPERGGGATSEPVIDANGTVFFASYPSGGSPDVRAVGRTGTILWERPIDGADDYLGGRLAVLADATILVASGSSLYRLRATDGSLVETIPFIHPIVSPLAVADDGTVYLMTGENRLIAIDNAVPLDPGAPWPIWQRDSRRTASVPRP